MENYLALRPEVFQPVKISLLGGKQIYNNITIVQKNPTQVGLAFRYAGQMKFGLYVTDQCIGKALKHSATGPVHDHKIIRK